jgi:hypothetical protein
MEPALLKITGNAGLPLTEIRRFLQSIETLYHGVSTIESMAATQRDLLRQINGPTQIDDSVFDAAADDSLVLNAAELHSPGYWELLGQLNPLTFLRDLLQDIHERQKDRSFRNQAEADALVLKNLLLKNRVLKEQITLLEKAGVDGEDIRALLMRQLLPPARELIRATEHKVCETALLAVAQQDEAD